jgi:DNA invertase Pin-like site-specific DNA recombinase
MKIGYARVSTGEQNLCLQRDALEAVGCEVIYQDEGISGVTIERHGLTQVLSALGEGDVLVLLCQILSEHSSLNCSVVIHHTTA